MLNEKNIYSLTLKDIYGRKVQLSTYQTKILIIVNLETLDGFATQSLLRLFQFKEEDYSDAYEILVFPIKDFLRTDQLKKSIIIDFCKPFLSLIKVFDFISIKDNHPLYAFLYNHSLEWLGNDMRENFVKFVVYENKIIHIYMPNEMPLHSDDKLRVFDKKNVTKENEQKEASNENTFY